MPCTTFEPVATRQHFIFNTATYRISRCSKTLDLRLNMTGNYCGMVYTDAVQFDLGTFREKVDACSVVLEHQSLLGWAESTA